MMQSVCHSVQEFQVDHDGHNDYSFSLFVYFVLLHISNSLFTLHFVFSVNRHVCSSLMFVMCVRHVCSSCMFVPFTLE